MQSALFSTGVLLQSTKVDPAFTNACSTSFRVDCCTAPILRLLFCGEVTSLCSLHCNLPAIIGPAFQYKFSCFNSCCKTERSPRLLKSKPLEFLRSGANKFS